VTIPSGGSAWLGDAQRPIFFDENPTKRALSSMEKEQFSMKKEQSFVKIVLSSLLKEMCACAMKCIKALASEVHKNSDFRSA